MQGIWFKKLFSAFFYHQQSLIRWLVRLTLVLWCDANVCIVAFFVAIIVCNFIDITIVVLFLFLIDFNSIDSTSQGLFSFIPSFLILFLFLFLANLLEKIVCLNLIQGGLYFFYFGFLWVKVFGSYFLDLHF